MKRQAREALGFIPGSSRIKENFFFNLESNPTGFPSEILKLGPLERGRGLPVNKID